MAKEQPTLLTVAVLERHEPNLLTVAIVDPPRDHLAAPNSISSSYIGIFISVSFLIVNFVLCTAIPLVPYDVSNATITFMWLAILTSLASAFVKNKPKLAQALVWQSFAFMAIAFIFLYHYIWELNLSEAEQK